MPESFMSLSSRHAIVAALLASGLAAGCGKKETDNSEVGSEAQASPEDSTVSAPPAPAGPTGNPITAPLTAADIERWEKGMAGELKAVQEAGAKMRTARTNDDSLNAMMGVQEMNTLAAGAQAAGLEQERYKFVRSNLSSVAGYMTPSLGGIDTTMFSQAQRDQLRQDNEAQIQRMQAEVPVEVVEALRPRAVELRTKSMELVGARLKGAGMQ
jgi:hypothetical protein